MEDKDDKHLVNGDGNGDVPSNSLCSPGSPMRNIFALALAWALTLSTSTLVTTVAPLSAVSIGASNSFAAFTIGVFLFGAAVSSVPSGWLFRRYGRLIGFSIGCFCQIFGSIFGSFAIINGDLPTLYLGCFFTGLGQGLGQFYRFTAVEVSPPRLKDRAVTYVLTGGIIAAFLGPMSASFTKNLFAPKYLGSYVMIAVFGILNHIILFMVRFGPPRETFSTEPLIKIEDGEEQQQAPKEKIRSRYEIVTQPQFIISCSIATLAHTIMVMLMSNASVAMTDNGYSFSDTALMMELHFFSMFSPGFFSGKLISKKGPFKVSVVGGVVFAAGTVILAVKSMEWNYFCGMILVGIAWNFSFSAGTVLLTKCYKPIEATEVQAINDFILFGVSGCGNILSGIIYSRYGWTVLIYVVGCMMVLYFLLFTIVIFYKIDTTTKPTQDIINNMVNPLHAESTKATISPIKRHDSKSSTSSDLSEGVSTLLTQGTGIATSVEPSSSVFLGGSGSRSGSGTETKAKTITESPSSSSSPSPSPKGWARKFQLRAFNIFSSSTPSERGETRSASFAGWHGNRTMGPFHGNGSGSGNGNDTGTGSGFGNSNGNGNGNGSGNYHLVRRVTWTHGQDMEAEASSSVREEAERFFRNESRDDDAYGTLRQMSIA